MKKGVLFINDNRIQIKVLNKMNVLAKVFQELNYIVWYIDGGQKSLIQ